MGNIRSFREFIDLYVDGFKHLTWGKPLWILIFIKLFVMFAVLKVFFFPNILSTRFDSDKEKSEYVFKELMKKQVTNKNLHYNESE
jgi:hypothetical protein